MEQPLFRAFNDDKTSHHYWDSTCLHLQLYLPDHCYLNNHQNLHLIEGVQKRCQTPTEKATNWTDVGKCQRANGKTGGTRRKFEFPTGFPTELCSVGSSDGNPSDSVRFSVGRWRRSRAPLRFSVFNLEGGWFCPAFAKRRERSEVQKEREGGEGRERKRGLKVLVVGKCTVSDYFC